MATETSHRVESGIGEFNWKAGAVGGILGSFVMGILIIVMNTAVIAVAIPSLYAIAPPPNPVAGMAVHLFHGAVLGIIFAGIVGAISLNSPGKVVGVGIVWGCLTWLVLAGLLMPTWLAAVGSPASPPFPNFAPPSLLWHVVYGAILGGGYLAVADRL